MISTAALATLAAYICSVAAHGGVVGIKVGSTTYPGYQPYNGGTQSTAERPYASFDPILNPSASTIHCNNNGASGAAQQDITVAAGSTVIGTYSQWTHAEGPYTVYMSACTGSSCTGQSSAGRQWFKIAEQGLISGTLAKGEWANGILMKNLQWPATIPANLKPGPYLMRYETLALHQANTPQFYPECIQVIVTGGGSVFPTSEYLKPIPGAWGDNDPGVKVDIYGEAAKTQTTYQIPGPPIYPGFGGTVPPVTSNRPASSSAAPPVSSASSVRPPTSTTSTASGAQQTKYGQCGGIGYTGPTVCQSPSTCKKSSDYYSQCL